MPPVQPMLAKSVKGIPDPAKHGGLELRAQVGRVPLHRVPRRRRGRAGQPQHQAADPLLPRGRHGDQGAAARAVRARRRALRGTQQRRGRPPGVRDAPGAHPPRCLPGQPAGRADTGRVRGLRPAGPRRRVVRRPPVLRAPRGAGVGAGRAGRSLLPDPHDRGPRGRRAVVQRVRGGRARRCGRQAARWRRTSRTPAPC